MFKIHRGHVLSDEKCVRVTKYAEPDYALFHNHDFFEIEYVLEGRGKHLIDDSVFEVSAGDVFFTNRYTPHCFMSEDKEKPVIVYNCIFTADYFEKIYSESGDIFDISDDELAVKLFPSCMKDVKFLKLENNNDFLLDSLEKIYSDNFDAEEIIYKIILKIMNENYKKQRLPGGREMMLSALYLNENYKNQVKADEVASLIYMSKEHLGKRFKAFWGMGIKEYCQRLVVSEVCEKLLKSDLSFEEISLEAGYSNTAYLRNLFKRYMGVLPREFKSRHYLN